MPIDRTMTPTGKLAIFAAVVVSLEIITFAARLGPAVTPFVLVLIPAVTAVGMSAIAGGRPAVARLTRRLVRVRVGARWYLAALGIPIVEKLTVDIAGVLLGATTPSRLVGALTISALAVPLVVLLPAMLEELGWRGFGVQTAVEQGHSPAWAALVVGAVFLALHVPLYLPGHLYAGLPYWPLPVILLTSSVLLTWVYLRTRECPGDRSHARGAERHRAAHLGTGRRVGLAGPPVVLLLITAVVVGRVGLTWWRSPLSGRSPEEADEARPPAEARPAASPAPPSTPTR